VVHVARTQLPPDCCGVGEGVGDACCGVGDGVGDAVTGGTVGDPAPPQAELVATGHDAKQGLKSTLDPSSNVRVKLAAPVAPPGDALHVAPPTRLIEKAWPATVSSASTTDRGKFEKMALV